MNVLFDLPEDDQRAILCQWLDILDLHALDGANCSHKYRPDYLTLISSPECIFPSFTCFHNSEASEWVIRRKLKFQEIQVHGTRDPSLREAVLMLSHATVTELVVLSPTALDAKVLQYKLTQLTQYDTDEDVCKMLAFVATHFSQLTKFCLFGGEGEAGGFSPLSWNSIVAVIQANPGLCTVIVEEGRNVSNNVIEALCGASHLENLTLTNCTYAGALQHLPPDLVNTSLRRLDYVTEAPFPELCSHFPNLTSLTGGAVDAADLHILTKACPHVTSIEVVGVLCGRGVE